MLWNPSFLLVTPLWFHEEHQLSTGAAQKGELYCSSAAQPAFLLLDQLLTAAALASRAARWRREAHQLPQVAAAKSKT